MFMWQRSTLRAVARSTNAQQQRTYVVKKKTQRLTPGKSLAETARDLPKPNTSRPTRGRNSSKQGSSRITRNSKVNARTVLEQERHVPKPSWLKTTAPKAEDNPGSSKVGDDGYYDRSVARRIASRNQSLNNPPALAKSSDAEKFGLNYWRMSQSSFEAPAFELPYRRFVGLCDNILRNTDRFTLSQICEVISIALLRNQGDLPSKLLEAAKENISTIKSDQHDEVENMQILLDSFISVSRPGLTGPGQVAVFTEHEQFPFSLYLLWSDLTKRNPLEWDVVMFVDYLNLLSKFTDCGVSAERAAKFTVRAFKDMQKVHSSYKKVLRESDQVRLNVALLKAAVTLNDTKARDAIMREAYTRSTFLLRSDAFMVCLIRSLLGFGMADEAEDVLFLMKDPEYKASTKLLKDMEALSKTQTITYSGCSAPALNQLIFYYGKKNDNDKIIELLNQFPLSKKIDASPVVQLLGNSSSASFPIPKYRTRRTPMGLLVFVHRIPAESVWLGLKKALMDYRHEFPDKKMSPEFRNLGIVYSGDINCLDSSHKLQVQNFLEQNNIKHEFRRIGISPGVSVSGEDLDKFFAREEASVESAFGRRKYVGLGLLGLTSLSSLYVVPQLLSLHQ